MAASEPFGLLTTGELEAAGVGGSDRARLVRGGALHRVRRGYYSIAPPSWLQSLEAARRHVGDTAVASHRSAARLHGLWASDDLDLTVRYPADSRAKGVDVHRSRDLIGVEVEMVAGLPTTTVPRTLCDLGLVLPPCEVERAVDHAIALGKTRLDDLLAVRARVGEHGRTGVGTVDLATADLPASVDLAESGPELRLLRLIAASSLPAPVQQHPVRVNGRSYRLDLAYPEVRVAIEYDGEDWHHTPAQLSRDRARQGDLEADGWRVVRLRWADLQPVNAGCTLSRIRQAIRSGGICENKFVEN